MITEAGIIIHSKWFIAMKLISISYSEHLGTSQEWHLRPMSLEDINLVVGRNASGKTRSINVLFNLAARLSGLIKDPMDSGNFHLSFASGDSRIEYNLEMHEKKVISEVYSINGVVRLLREPGGSGLIYAEKEKKDLEFQTPDDQLAAVSRQDALQHSYLNDLLEWSKGVHYIPFGSHLGQGNFILFQEGAPQVNVRDPNQATAIYRKGYSDFGEVFKEQVIMDMGLIGYDLEDIGVTLSTSVMLMPAAAKLSCLYIKERGVPAQVEQLSISQGMFRALSTIIQVNYSAFAGGSQLLLIDDIGEGLDYGRSSDLIKLLVERIKDTSTQLIASTNDRFIMNGINLRYWTILDRRSNVVYPLNYRNSKEIFDEFRFTGLSNFDFLSREFFKEAAK